MNRRELLCSAAGMVPVWMFASYGQANSRMGVADFSFSTRRKVERDRRIQDGIDHPQGLLEHCHELGAGGIQKGLGVRDDAECEQLRRTAEEYGMYVEGSIGVPRRESDAERFEAGVRTAKRAGARVLRTPMGGRRYEAFDSLEQYKQWADSTEKAVQRAEPILAKHSMFLAIENHKDRRVDEMLALLKRIDSEYVGMCVDMGNDVAMLSDPVEVAKAYAPWAKSAHVKDAAVAEYDGGFLLADVVIGQGIINLAEIVRILRAANPAINFSLEMSTRDPLRVPCLTDKYWATFPNVPGHDLARTLRMVRAKATPTSELPRVEHLPMEERVALEEVNVKKCLAYAREHLGL